MSICCVEQYIFDTGARVVNEPNGYQLLDTKCGSPDRPGERVAHHPFRVHPAAAAWEFSEPLDTHHSQVRIRVRTVS
jgi:hypothetical protein